jgi:hypothetical protein
MPTPSYGEYAEFSLEVTADVGHHAITDRGIR